MKQFLQNLAMATVDQLMAVVPRAVPDEAALRRCKIVSHRGEHDNRTVLENTLRAFDNASAAGVWGLECDIRWTRDLLPVICHDASLERVFGIGGSVADMDFQQLRELAPAVPSLQEMVLRYGGQQHLMLEVKEYSPAQLQAQRSILGEILGSLQPGVDFHMLALDPELFTIVDFLDPGCLLPVAETNVARLSRVSLQRGYAGLTGHYLLLGEALKQRHRAAGQCIGTGFPRSRNCLLREINRGVEWVFSNDAVLLQEELDLLLDHP